MVVYPNGRPESISDFGMTLSQWYVDFPRDSFVIDDSKAVLDVHRRLTELSDTMECNPRKHLLVFLLYENGREIGRGAVGKHGWMFYNGHCCADNKSAFQVVAGCLHKELRDSLEQYIKSPW